MSRKPALPWTEAETDLIRQLYPDTPTAEIALQLQRTKTSVYSRAYVLGLTKSDAFLKTAHSGRLSKFCGRGSAWQFKPGGTPWNAGMKGYYPGGEAGMKQWFKPGTLSGAAKKNFRPVGTIRTGKDGVIEIKVSCKPGSKKSAAWRPVHVEIWTAANGQMPPDHICVLRDGDHTNLVLENIECISRQEHMRRNSVHRLPKELAECAQLRGALKRRINNLMEKRT
jgi:hypothetical protein